MSILNKPVLIVNSGGIPTGETTVQEAISDVYTGSKRAMKIEYWKDENGQYDFEKCVELLALIFADWSQLGPREFDESCIKSAKMEIRIPTVVSCPNYHNTNVKTFKPTKSGLLQHYDNTDYWTGEKFVSHKKVTIDHLISKDEWKRRGLRGSPNNWKNLVPTLEKINRLKSNMNPKDFERIYGYKPHYKLSEPKARPTYHGVKSKHIDWDMFLKFLK